MMNLKRLHIIDILVFNIMEMFEISKKCPKYGSCQVAPFLFWSTLCCIEVPFSSRSTPKTTQGTTREPTGSLMAPLFLSVYLLFADIMLTNVTYNLAVVFLVFRGLLNVLSNNPFSAKNGQKAYFLNENSNYSKHYILNIPMFVIVFMFLPSTDQWSSFRYITVNFIERATSMIDK